MGFLQTNTGLVVGTLTLIAAWFLLNVLGRHGRNIGSLITRSLRRPLLIGLGVSLYSTWITHWIDKRIDVVDQLTLKRLSATLLIITISWATLNVGHAILQSGSMRRWIQMDDEQDEAMLINLLGRLFTILTLLITTAAMMVNLGIPSAAIATLLGGAGIGFTFATQQISQNFLSGFMLFFNRPFKEGDWINVDELQGTVESIGWYYTRIRTFDRRPLNIPNSIFATKPIENPGQMYNRRILANISLRYEDISKIAGITDKVREHLKQHPHIDQKQIILVNFNQWDASSINMMVYCFTKTTVWAEWLNIQQAIFLDIAGIVQGSGADFAFNCMTLYPASSSNPNQVTQLLSPDAS
ncbi:mechanosensitive ion channel family protein [Synechococcus sp. CS-197]|nr:mechanosensitive ion channel family protein [Synechococcus sp. CS-197]CAK24862.1 Possible small-conductance mechanosensitive ion channel, MscS family [Synechococcus sp. WH 7803]